MRVYFCLTLISFLLGIHSFAEDLPNKQNDVVEGVVPQALGAVEDVAVSTVDESKKTLEQEFDSKINAELELNTVLEKELAQKKAVQPLESRTALIKRVNKDFDTKNINESEIPVLAAVKEKKESSANPMLRLVISFFILAAVGIGLVFFSKWYSKTYKKTADNNKIKILNQHFIGPKKSLAIVRVAGESILIGITDHNISMLKTLSLLDEELPDAESRNFDAALSHADNQAATSPSSQVHAETDDFIIGSIKDKISLKIKNMRSL